MTARLESDLLEDFDESAHAVTGVFRLRVLGMSCDCCQTANEHGGWYQRVIRDIASLTHAATEESPKATIINSTIYKN